MATTRMRLRIQVTLAAITALLTVVTLISHEWIELVFGVDPDGGSGATRSRHRTKNRPDVPLAKPACSRIPSLSFAP